ncbi:hypothetical protein NQ318_016120 [Aromia moschata]|uniref:Uncharacterized protein n=1 Tax=Aromia moschata TaxID=1265417 RepID=A0AAV8XEA1_9CUCU|nr:hypothetical protein NQ318_016120 [Aromia moschata]
MKVAMQRETRMRKWEMSDQYLSVASMMNESVISRNKNRSIYMDVLDRLKKVFYLHSILLYQLVLPKARIHQVLEELHSSPSGGHFEVTRTLARVTEKITNLMKEKDVLFKNMYERKFYGGSYYDGIKVGKPEEYDLDYVLNLPLIVEPVVEASDSPGFVHVRITEYMTMLKRDEATKFGTLLKTEHTRGYPKITVTALPWAELV